MSKPRFVPGLALRVLRQIIDHPETWDQHVYENTCGTARCAAGHAIAFVYGPVYGDAAREAATDREWTPVERTGWLASVLLGADTRDAYPHFEASADPRPWLAGLARRDHLMTCSVGSAWSDRMREVAR